MGPVDPVGSVGPVGPSSSDPVGPSSSDSPMILQSKPKEQFGFPNIIFAIKIAWLKCTLRLKWM